MVSKGWRDPFNKTTRLTMPAFGSVLSPDQIRAVITYLKTLWMPEQQNFSQRRAKVTRSRPPGNDASTCA